MGDTSRTSKVHMDFSHSVRVRCVLVKGLGHETLECYKLGGLTAQPRYQLRGLMIFLMLSFVTHANLSYPPTLPKNDLQPHPAPSIGRDFQRPKVKNMPRHNSTALFAAVWFLMMCLSFPWRVLFTYNHSAGWKWNQPRSCAPHTRLTHYSIYPQTHL